MLKYIQLVKEDQSQKSKAKDVIEVLVKNMGTYQPERSHTTVHASDVTKSGFCVRQYRLMDVLGISRPDMYVPPALRATWDMGKAVADLICNEWAGDKAIGNWYCRRCEITKYFKPKPQGGCNKMQKCEWTYKEMAFIHKEHRISGSVDLLLDVGAARVMLIELKIMKADDWEKLVAPLGEHKARTQLYLQLVAESTNPFKEFVNTDEARVLYISRSHGKMNKDVGHILPFKEFTVQRDDEAVAPYVALGAQVQAHRVNKTIPVHKVCDNVGCQTAKRCPVRAACWSGAHL